MIPDETIVAPSVTTDEIEVAAPSPRAKALRDEIFGSALTLDEVAYVLSLDRTTVAKYLRENVIVGFQIGREWLVPEEELRAYVQRTIEQRRVDAAAGMSGSPADAASDESAGSKGEWRAIWLRGRRRGPGISFEQFSEPARKVLTLAQEEAKRLNHRFIGTEHLLLGLTDQSKSGATRILTNLGIDLQQLRSAVEAMVRPGTDATGEVGLSRRAKKALELAIDESRRLRHRVVETEDLLLGLIDEGSGAAASALEALGVNLDRVRAEAVRVVEERLARGNEPAAMEIPAVPSEAAALVRDGEASHDCPRCGARNPAYFRYCFCCGERSEAATERSI